MSGNSRSGRRVNEITPSTISSRLTTVAKTGRWIEMSDSFIVRRRRFAARRRAPAVVAPASTTRSPGCSLTVPSTTTRSPAFQARHDFDHALAARAEFHRHLLRPCRRRRRGTPSSARLPAAPRAPAAPAPGACGNCTCTRSSMPGRSLPSGFGSSARTRTARVSGSTRLSMSAMRPSKVTPGHASLAAVIDWPGATAPTTRLPATVKSSLIVLSSSSVVITVPGATSAPRLTCRNPSTPANGAVIVRSATAARLACTLAAAASRLARRVSYWPRAMQLRLGQFGAATQLLLGVAQRGLRGGDVGLLRAAVHVGEQLSGTHALAAVERQPRHHVADLGGDRHRFARLRRAQRLQRVVEGTRPHPRSW